MFIIQVTINPADQNSSVLVAHPAGNGHVVDAAHHGVADEVVAANRGSRNLPHRQCLGLCGILL